MSQSLLFAKFLAKQSPKTMSTSTTMHQHKPGRQLQPRRQEHLLLPATHPRLSANLVACMDRSKVPRVRRLSKVLLSVSFRFIYTLSCTDGAPPAADCVMMVEEEVGRMPIPTSSLHPVSEVVVREGSTGVSSTTTAALPADGGDREVTAKDVR
ncbi:hypothetical protein PHYPSEUDO_013299 [Phytophthora pseudosyringae]|uniref:Uncharacterized protein n=1 Tax=Phytophthora pseudosyringae TaxID=221518 RepID=A0A8T1V5G0_9STRA|nr:hypothetical protein PHYPSEUDO_013299 [Phytophthora pseudosyringae]